MPMDPWSCPVAEETACDWRMKLTDPTYALYRDRGVRDRPLGLPLVVRDLGDDWDVREVHGYESIADTVGPVSQAVHMKQVHPLDPRVPQSTFVRLMP